MTESSLQILRKMLSVKVSISRIAANHSSFTWLCGCVWIFKNLFFKLWMSSNVYLGSLLYYNYISGSAASVLLFSQWWCHVHPDWNSNGLVCILGLARLVFPHKTNWKTFTELHRREITMVWNNILYLLNLLDTIWHDLVYHNLKILNYSLLNIVLCHIKFDRTAISCH